MNLPLSLGQSRYWIYQRDLLYELVSRNIKIRYKGSILGILWSLIYSVAQARVFGFLFRSGLGDGIPNFPAYVFIGILVWTWIQSALTAGSESITSSSDLIRKPGFPAIILPAVTVATSLIDFLIALPVLLAFLIYGGTPLTSLLLLVPFLLAVQFLFTLSLVYILATFQVTFRDTKHIVTVVLRLGFFLTPIFYDAARMIPEHYQWLYRLNPIVHLLEVYRAIILLGELPDPMSMFILCGLTAILLPFGYKLFVNAKYRFLEEL
jgi:lipopolysaccharide transport system permease protein